jgi:uncharacterized membrane-anchored protein YhcB (DUF1043 family)
LDSSDESIVRNAAIVSGLVGFVIGLVLAVAVVTMVRKQKKPQPETDQVKYRKSGELVGDENVFLIQEF